MMGLLGLYFFQNWEPLLALLVFGFVPLVFWIAPFLYRFFLRKYEVTREDAFSYGKLLGHTILIYLIGLVVGVFDGALFASV